MNPGKVNKSISQTDAFKWVESNHRHAIDRYVANINGRIFRGIKSITSQYLYVKPSQFARQSRNTINIYTALFDILPSWKEYPKRSRSIICSNEEEYAGGYKGYSENIGSLYIVLPKDGSKIGICPERDIWESFRLVKSRWRSNTMNTFNIEFLHLFMNLYDLVHGKYILDDLREADGNIMNDFLGKAESDITKHTALAFKKQKSLNKQDDYLIEDVLYFKFAANKTWLEYFDELLNPKSNGFKTQTIEQFNAGNDSHEVWTDGDCLLVSMTHFDEWGDREDGNHTDVMDNLIKKTRVEVP